MKLNIIAKRQLIAVSIDTAEEKELTISVGAPELIDSSGGARCFVGFDWLSEKLSDGALQVISFAYGSDAVSALKAALEFDSSLALFTDEYRFYHACSECDVDDGCKLARIKPLRGFSSLDDVIECKPDSAACDKIIGIMDRHLRMFKKLKELPKKCSY